MFHSNTEQLIATWRKHRAGSPIPARSALSPIDLGPILPQIFMLGQEEGEPIFRLCGGLIADLYGRDLRGVNFLSLFDRSERPLVSEALGRAVAARTPVVMTVDGAGPFGEIVGIEVCLAPMTGPSGAVDRTLGFFQPISMLSRLMGQPIRRLSLRGSVLAVERRDTPTIRLVALNGRRVA